MAVRKSRSVAGELIEKILKQRRVKKSELAEALGKNPAGISAYLNSSMRFEDVVSIANFYGYDVTLSPAPDGTTGSLRFQEQGICDVCRYKKFAKAVENSLDRFKAKADEVGTIIDFYAPDEDEHGGEYFHGETEI